MNSHVRKHPSSTEIAVEQLRDLIFVGKLGPGTDHLESELAEELGMSRTPVREALLILEGQGLVDVRPRKGARIKPISLDDIAEIYDVLIELESCAAQSAAVLKPNETELASLARFMRDIETALTANDREAWAVADNAFHTELVRLGKNARIIEIVALMSDQLKRVRRVTLHMRPDPAKSGADHRNLFNAIRNGDADAASRLHRAHRTMAKTMLIQLLEAHNLHAL